MFPLICYYCRAGAERRLPTGQTLCEKHYQKILKIGINYAPYIEPGRNMSWSKKDDEKFDKAWGIDD